MPPSLAHDALTAIMRFAESNYPKFFEPMRKAFPL